MRSVASEQITHKPNNSDSGKALATNSLITLKFTALDL